MAAKECEYSEAGVRGQRVRDGKCQLEVPYRQLERQVIKVEERRPKPTVEYLIIESSAISA